jgi:hypothetical protein
MSDDIIRAMQELRRDPAIADIVGDAAGTPRAVLPTRADSPPSAQLKQTPASPSSAFITRRNRDPDEMGVLNWVSKHRDELSDADARRLDHRLRAEHLFATAQLEMERFNVDSISSRTAQQEEDAVRRADLALPAVLQSVAPTGDEMLPTQVLSMATPVRAAAPSPAVSPAPALALAAASPAAVTPTPYAHEPLAATADLSHMSATAGPPAGYLPRGGAPVPVAHSTSLLIDTEKELGALDEESNYAAKQRLLAQDDKARALVPGGYAAGSAAAAVSPRASRHDADVLLEAIHQRDRTIHHLEQQLAQEREHFEDTLRRTKDDNEQLRRHSDSRVTILAAQLDEISRQSITAQSSATSDAQSALQNTESMFAKHADDLREETTALLRNYQFELDARLRHVVETADLTVRSVREAHVVEKGEVIVQEKDGLVQRLAREQELMLREAELRLRDDTTRSSIATMKAEVERYIADKTEAEIVPRVQTQIAQDAVGAFGGALRDEVAAMVREGMDELRETLRREVAAENERLQLLSATLATETMSTSAALLDEGAVNEHMALFQQLQREAADTAARRRDGEEEHAELVKQLRRRTSQLEDDLTTERRVSKSLAAELLRLNTTKGVVA